MNSGPGSQPAVIDIDSAFRCLAAQGATVLADVPLDPDNAALRAIGARLGHPSPIGLARRHGLVEPGCVQRVEAQAIPINDDGGKPLKSANRDSFDLHTDQSFVAQPCRYVLLHCWRTAESGGETLLASKDDLLAMASRPLTIALSQYRFRYPCGEIVTVGSQLRFCADSIALERPDDARWRDHIAAALAAVQRTFELRSGDLLIIDNHRCAHGRRAFAGQRLLKRLRVG
jgi:alpha-ketoglutarate-dependent taurine dioxygenase